MNSIIQENFVIHFDNEKTFNVIPLLKEILKKYDVNYIVSLDKNNSSETPRLLFNKEIIQSINLVCFDSKVIEAKSNKGIISVSELNIEISKKANDSQTTYLNPFYFEGYYAHSDRTLTHVVSIHFIVVQSSLKKETSEKKLVYNFHEKTSFSNFLSAVKRLWDGRIIDGKAEHLSPPPNIHETLISHGKKAINRLLDLYDQSPHFIPHEPVLKVPCLYLHPHNKAKKVTLEAPLSFTLSFLNDHFKPSKQYRVKFVPEFKQ